MNARAKLPAVAGLLGFALAAVLLLRLSFWVMDARRDSARHSHRLQADPGPLARRDHGSAHRTGHGLRVVRRTQLGGTHIFFTRCSP